MTKETSEVNSNNKQQDYNSEESEASDDEDEDVETTNNGRNIDENVSCKITASNNTDAPSVNICKGVLLMIKTAKMRAEIEKKVTIHTNLPWKKLMR